MNVVGEIDYEACDRCKHQREDGGCDPLDDEGAIWMVCWLTETIRCDRYEEKEP